MRERVQGMGGEFLIQTAEGKRHSDFDCASFEVRFPARGTMSNESKSPKSRLTRPRPVTAIKKEPAKKIEVLIADDHSTFLAGLTSIIDMEDDMIVVAQATDGRQAVDLWRKHRPTVTLLDLRMPLLDGVGAINAIRQEDGSAQIIVLTTYDSDQRHLPRHQSGHERLFAKGCQARRVAGLHSESKHRCSLPPTNPHAKAHDRHTK